MMAGVQAEVCIADTVDLIIKGCAVCCKINNAITDSVSR